MKQLTYEELFEAIKQMTPIQRKHPVKFFAPMIKLEAELLPRDETNHPEISCSSKIILAKNVFLDGSSPFQEERYKNQFVIVEYIEEDEDRKLQLLRWKEILLMKDLGFEQRQHCEKMISPLEEGRDLMELMVIHFATTPDPDPLTLYEGEINE